MGLDVELLRSSFALVTDRQPQLTLRFYEHLFEAHPELQPLFKSRTRDAQAQMLQEALVAVLDHLEDAPWLTDTLGSLGARHQGYGVTPPMYDYVGEALLKTLAEAAGEDWSDALHQSWSDAYGAIRDMALAGCDDRKATG